MGLSISRSIVEARWPGGDIPVYLADWSSRRILSTGLLTTDRLLSLYRQSALRISGGPRVDIIIGWSLVDELEENSNPSMPYGLAGIGVAPAETDQHLLGYSSYSPG